jgi:outer membrane protein
LFRNKEEKLNNDLQQIKNQYNKLWEETNQNAASLSEEEKIKRKQTLDMLEQSYKSKQEMQGAELQSEGFRYRQEITKKIQEFLKKYNQEKGYAFILSNSNDLLYYKDTVYNITQDLVKGLNAEYKPKK